MSLPVDQSPHQGAPWRTERSLGHACLCPLAEKGSLRFEWVAGRFRRRRDRGRLRGSRKPWRSVERVHAGGRVPEVEAAGVAPALHGVASCRTHRSARAPPEGSTRALARPGPVQTKVREPGKSGATPGTRGDGLDRLERSGATYRIPHSIPGTLSRPPHRLKPVSRFSTLTSGSAFNRISMK